LEIAETLPHREKTSFSTTLDLVREADFSNVRSYAASCGIFEVFLEEE